MCMQNAFLVTIPWYRGWRILIFQPQPPLGSDTTEQRARGQAFSWDKEHLALRQPPAEPSASFMRMNEKLLLVLRQVLRVYL